MFVLVMCFWFSLCRPLCTHLQVSEARDHLLLPQPLSAVPVSVINVFGG